METKNENQEKVSQKVKPGMDVDGCPKKRKKINKINNNNKKIK